MCSKSNESTCSRCSLSRMRYCEEVGLYFCAFCGGIASRLDASAGELASGAADLDVWKKAAQWFRPGVVVQPDPVIVARRGHKELGVEFYQRAMDTILSRGLTPDLVDPLAFSVNSPTGVATFYRTLSGLFSVHDRYLHCPICGKEAGGIEKYFLIPSGKAIYVCLECDSFWESLAEIPSPYRNSLEALLSEEADGIVLERVLLDLICKRPAEPMMRRS